jgi:hypothetical protein
MNRTFRAAALIASAAMLASAAVAQTVNPDDPQTLFARERAAVGGDAWNGIAGIASSGTVVLGGAPSSFSQVLDHRSGFTKSRTVIGSVTDVSGYDGVAWDFQGGPVTEQTLPGLQADNVTQAYMARDGWWHPDTDPATMTPLDPENGQNGVRVTPAGGSPVDVWFDPVTGLIDRTVALTDYGRVVTWIDDYRTVGDVVIAFHEVARDPAGALTTTDTALAVPLRSIAKAELARPLPVSSGRIAGGGAVGRASFRLSDDPGEILVPVRIGAGRLPLMFDSGAGNYLIPQGAQRLRLRTAGGLPMEGVGNGSVNASLASVGTIALGTAELVDQHFVVAPLPYVFYHQRMGKGLYGLVGSEFLESFRTTFDFDAHTITFAPFALPPQVPAGAVTVPFYSDGAHAYVSAKVDGVSGLFLLDTGDNGDITVFRRFAVAHGLFTGNGVPYLSIGGVGGHLGYERYRAATFSLGGGTMHQPPVAVSDASAGAFASRSVAGNIGLRVISRYTITFDFRRNTVTFVPRAGIDAHFTQDRVGLSVTQEGPAAFTVLSIVPGGPAAQAGLHPGDDLVAINGHNVAREQLGTNDLHPYFIGAKPFTLTIAAKDGTQRTVTIQPRDLLPYRS